MKRVCFLASAESELLALYSYLEECQEGLGDRFDVDYSAACQRLSQFPEIGPVFHGGLRRLLMSKWSIGLDYAVEGDRVMIHGVIDCRRSPKNIRKQLGLI